MPTLPPGITPTTVTATIKGDDGTPATGSVTFTPSKATWVDDDTDKVILLPVPVVGTLDATGEMIGPDGTPGVPLVPTDSPVISPKGWTYDVAINVHIGTNNFTLSYSVAVISTPILIDLTQLIPIAPDGSGGRPIVLKVNGKTPDGTGNLTLTAADVGALSVAPVVSVNGKTGVVILSATDVGAIPTGGAVATVNGHTGTSVTLSASDVGAVPVQSPVALTFANPIATDASLGTHFRVTLTGDTTLANPTNATDGKRVIWELIQDGTGSRHLATDTKFRLGSDVPAIAPSTTAGARDFLCAIYIAATDSWDVVTFVRGY